MTDLPINSLEERREYASLEPFGGRAHSRGYGSKLFFWTPHLPDPQRALLHNLLSEDEIVDLRSRISAVLPNMFENLLAELSLEAVKRYQRLATKLESIEQDYERLSNEVAELREAISASEGPNVSRILERVHHDAALVSPQERVTSLKRAAEKRATGRQLDADVLSEQIRNFVRAEIENAPDEDY